MHKKLNYKRLHTTKKWCDGTCAQSESLGERKYKRYKRHAPVAWLSGWWCI